MPLKKYEEFICHLDYSWHLLSMTLPVNKMSQKKQKKQLYMKNCIYCCNVSHTKKCVLTKDLHMIVCVSSHATLIICLFVIKYNYPSYGIHAWETC